MRLFVTGAGGFVGHWLEREARRAGHEVVGPSAQQTDVTLADDVRDAIAAASPDAVIHLAAVAYAPDAGADPERAFRVNLGGTINVLEAVRSLPAPPAVLVTGSSEVYGTPRPEELPLAESARLAPRNAYALSKAAQEGVALAFAARHGLRAAVTRSFNHSGPGQRPVFVVPALAARVLAVRDGAEREIRVGNLDVRRDFTDVRDVVRAYRLLVEALVDGRVAPGGAIFNVASGRAVAIRDILGELCSLAGVAPALRTDPGLVRADDPPEIRGDASALHAVTGWRPERTVHEMLADAWADTAASATSTSPTAHTASSR